MEGTKASEEVWNIVKTGKDYQSDGIDISGAKYYVYYTPVCTDDGKVIGMAFAGEKEAIVNDAKNNLMISFVKIALVLTVVYLIILIWLARIIRKPIAKQQQILKISQTVIFLMKSAVLPKLRKQIS